MQRVRWEYLGKEKNRASNRTSEVGKRRTRKGRRRIRERQKLPGLDLMDGT